ncbi:hypothetical protein [Streptomyces sioyaensis]|uniref:hypothetical protein n=1 Tax=Streptomyces sioyaensis TaxID=67364 RepID=UPI003EBDA38B
MGERRGLVLLMAQHRGQPVQQGVEAGGERGEFGGPAGRAEPLRGAGLAPPGGLVAHLGDRPQGAPHHEPGEEVDGAEQQHRQRQGTGQRGVRRTAVGVQAHGGDHGAGLPGAGGGRHRKGVEPRRAGPAVGADGDVGEHLVSAGQLIRPPLQCGGCAGRPFLDPPALVYPHAGVQRLVLGGLMDHQPPVRPGLHGGRHGLRPGPQHVVRLLVQPLVQREIEGRRQDGDPYRAGDQRHQGEPAAQGAPGASHAKR